MSTYDTSCKKCGAPMKPLPPQRGSSPIERAAITITGFRCDCGHWNDFKLRKGYPKK